MVTFLTFYLILMTNIYRASCEELYGGCYTNFSGFSIDKNPIQSISQCLNECRKYLEITSFSAIKDGSSCYCGYLTYTRVPLSNCNLTCGDNNGICGGNNLFSVYMEIPTNEGCFKDDINSRAMKIAIENDLQMTIDKCYERCSSLNCTFMAVQAGGSCYCDTQYTLYGRAPESECNMTCTGDGKQICGGPARNNIYTVEVITTLGKFYDQLFHCLNGATDMHGTCSSKTCQPGWKGTKCNQRDCTINNGNCGQHTCQEYKISNQVISECVCKEGFRSISIYDECKDIEECYLNMCNLTTSTCNNTIGSFDCICKEGFVKIPLNQVDYKGEYDKKLKELTCVRKECDKQRPFVEDKRDIIILATFLTFFICTQIILISAVLFYRSKNRKLAMTIRERNTDAMSDSTYRHLDFSSQSLDDHNYSELAKNNELKK